MGEAKRRGTFEERKEQAIKEGREKTKKVKKDKPFDFIKHYFPFLKK